MSDISNTRKWFSVILGGLLFVAVSTFGWTPLGYAYFSWPSLIIRAILMLIGIRLLMFLDPIATSEVSKWVIATIGAILFLLIGSQILYRGTNFLGSRIGAPTLRNDVPTMLGIILHALVFVIVAKLFFY